MDTLPQADIEQLAAAKEELNRLSEAALKGDESAQQQLGELYRASIQAGQTSPRYFRAYWKLNANDVAAFERGLREFANDYREDGMQSVSINEYYEPKQPTDPAKHRSWSVTFTQPSKDKDYLFVSNVGARFTVSVMGGDYPMLLKVDSVMDTARPFVAAWIEWCKSLWDAVPAPSKQAQKRADNGQRDSGHFNYPPEKRREIVKAFRAAREIGEVENIEAWAQSNYNIGRKTLRSYEKEFDAET